MPHMYLCQLKASDNIRVIPDYIAIRPSEISKLLDMPEDQTRKIVNHPGCTRGQVRQQRSVKWGNTKKEARKIFSVNKREHGKTDGGPQAKPVSVAVNRTINLCNDSASFKGIEGVESCIFVNLSDELLNRLAGEVRAITHDTVDVYYESLNKRMPLKPFSYTVYDVNKKIDFACRTQMAVQTDVDDPNKSFSKVFTGLGCIEKLNPVIKPPRKIPATLREKLKGTLKEMENKVIGKVDEPTDWVNWLVVVEKPKTGKLRIC
ncbi:Hypothetical predicted protein [Mytilus galloprovincialis]|uniref:Uncharacterized protein n=1 Tax=Mytilus galloprovincialis TaxID=29158 RepID=A0A8B6G8G2_MYTGA|nr:Hypothetical predicted protein [Mytilus galloprovincialis]